MTFVSLVFGVALVAITLPPTSSLRRSDDAFLRAYPMTIDARTVHIPHCSDVDAFEGELAFANVEVKAHVPFPRVDRRGNYTGRTQFTIRHVTLHVPAAVVWPGMTRRDRAEAAAAVAALRHHEVGHVRVAAAEVARLNALTLTVTPDAEAYRRTEMRRQTAGLDAIARAQRAYDRLTEHGRSQPRAPGPLRGPVAEMHCERTVTTL
ncbi:MAG TPA: DUF922 domain-containing protein [Candidatus Elarobacter sp.]|nr:DUF922 domain-containing protein [Candidatus Elarobacter sp.]